MIKNDSDSNEEDAKEVKLVNSKSFELMDENINIKMAKSLKNYDENIQIKI